MLTVVLWNPANPHCAMISFHPGDEPLDKLVASEGKSITEVCEEHGVSIATYMEMFPGCCRPDDWIKDDPLPSRWDVPMIELTLPSGDNQRRKLAQLLGVDFTVHTYERRSGFQIDPQTYAA